jgi:hypothetical protein
MGSSYFPGHYPQIMPAEPAYRPNDSRIRVTFLHNICVDAASLSDSCVTKNIFMFAVTRGGN